MMLWLDGSVPPPGPDSINIPRWVFSGISGLVGVLLPAFLGLARSWFKLKSRRDEIAIEKDVEQKTTLDALHKRIDNYLVTSREHEQRLYKLEGNQALILDRQERDFHSKPIDLPDLPQVDRTRRFKRPKPEEE